MPASTYLLALDQGTSSSRSMVFDARGRIAAQAQQELAQIYPQPGWVEHDPQAIWRGQLQTARRALAQGGLCAGDIRAIGITNQRETTLLWSRKSGAPLHHAIVWQDRRGEDWCAHMRASGHGQLVAEKTGLRLDAYFCASKLCWLLEHIPGARAQAQRGELAFGTVDSWLLWQLTGGARHATDISNASRTLLFNIHTRQWDEELLALFDIPRALLPEVLPSSADYGSTAEEWFGSAIPIRALAGDQQSALFGQACFDAGQAKNTYGTGCFMLLHTGDAARASSHGLITTCAAQAGAASRAAYALEGSVFVGGAVVQWLRDGLRAIDSSAQVQALAQTVPDSGGVMFVPAFTGLGAPYWKPHARGTIVGLTRGSTLAHIARAALESIACQSAALLHAMQRDALFPVREMRVDGGACVNDLLMQFQADLLSIPVLRPACVETTALGAAYLAALACGIWQNTQELQSLWQVERRFEPAWEAARAQEFMQRWKSAVAQAVA